jgi:hypothetical protein
MIDKRSEGREVTVSREGMEEAQKTWKRRAWISPINVVLSTFAGSQAADWTDGALIYQSTLMFWDVFFYLMRLNLSIRPRHDALDNSFRLCPLYFSARWTRSRLLAKLSHRLWTQ